MTTEELHQQLQSEREAQSRQTSALVRDLAAANVKADSLADQVKKQHAEIVRLTAKAGRWETNACALAEVLQRHAAVLGRDFGDEDVEVVLRAWRKTAAMDRYTGTDAPDAEEAERA